MEDMRYLQSEEKFLKYAFQTLKEHFKDMNELEQFYRSIKTDEDKNLFLKISSFYLYLVKNCSITHDINGTAKPIDYISNTLKYVAIFSLIEGLYSKNKYIDFFEFLMKKSNQIQFPVSEEQLRSHYNNYKKQYGATRKAVAFFKQIEDLYDSHLKGKIKILKDKGKTQDLTIDEFSKILYDIRSKFVHQAKLISQLSKGSVISSIGSKRFLWEMDIKDLMYVFEKGLLKFFEAKK